MGTTKIKNFQLPVKPWTSYGVQETLRQVINNKKSPFMLTNFRTRTILGAFLLIGMAWLASCQKDNNPASPADLESAVAASDAEAIQDANFNEVFDDVAGIDDATAGEDLGIYGTDGDGIFSAQAAGSSLDATNQPLTRCFTVSVTPRQRGVFPKTVTIDFGTGCEVRGRLRKGKIITVYTGRMHVPGSSATTTFENFSIDNFAIEGKHTLTNATQPGGNTRVFTATVEGGKITNTTTEEWCQWNGARTRTQVEGNGSPFYPLDDVFQVTGKREVTCSGGKKWSSEVTTPLVRKFTCRWFVSGVLTITLPAGQAALDFGNGTCDRKATLTFNGERREITLR
jgi:hypothetical protein